jgi:hypothetical protein
MTSLKEIHESLINGQRRQMADKIDQYGLYDVWDDLNRYVSELYAVPTMAMAAYVDIVISYHRIRNR